MQAFDFGNPRARTPRRQLGEVREGRGADINQMLTLQAACVLHWAIVVSPEPTAAA